MRSGCLGFFLVIFCGIAAQTGIITGKVIDAETHEPLAFVVVQVPGTKTGTITDLQGKFSLLPKDNIAALKFSYVGYEPLTLTLKGGETDILVALTMNTQSIREVVILPGENPAHRIIRAVRRHAGENDPASYNSYECSSYTKMFITGEFASDSAGLKKALSDTSRTPAREFFSRQHLFINETVTRKKYRKPGKESEIIIGSKVSGFTTAPFFTPVAQLQSFSFYASPFIILDKQYVNPIDPGTFARYFFLLEDTLFENKDTVYVISFRPKKGKNFEGLSGILYVNTSNYAIQRVIAEPIDKTGVISAHVEQIYEPVRGKWFPKAFQTDWYYNTFKLTDSTLTTTSRSFSDKTTNKIKVVCQSYIFDTRIDSINENEKIPVIAIDPDKGYDSHDSIFWNSYRKEQLTEKDSLTYRKLDSIGKVEHFDRKLKTWEVIASGRIPLGIVDLELKHLFSYNEVEKVRIGIGLTTSRRLSEVINLGAYAAYAFGDAIWKYGGRLAFLSRHASEAGFSIEYLSDVEEPGKTEWFLQRTAVTGESARQYLIDRLDYTDRLNIQGQIRFARFFKLRMGLHSRKIFAPYGFSYNDTSQPGIEFFFKGLNVFESYTLLRWQHQEKMMRSRFGTSSLGSKWPSVSFKWTHGIVSQGIQLLDASLFYGNYAFDKVEMNAQFTIRTRTKGVSVFRVVAGIISEPLPFPLLFVPSGSYERFGYFAQGTFETMRVNEFMADRILCVFHKHDLGKISRKRKFNPSLALLNNFAIGSVNRSVFEPGFFVKDLEDGFMESGIQVNGLIRNQFISLGLQGMYRYGGNSLGSPELNYSVKTTLQIEF